MADRYWVSGSGNWSDTAHWSTTSGGSGGASVPTSSDDVFIDSNSGLNGGTITLNVDWPYAICNDISSYSGHTFSIIGSYPLIVYGSLTFESGITFSAYDIEFNSELIGKTIKINSAIIDTGIGFYGHGGSWILQDDLNITGEFYQENGTFDANDHNVTADNFYFYAEIDDTPTVIMGSGIWEATGSSYIWEIDQNEGEVVTIIPETSTIKVTNATAENKYFNGGGKTYNNLWLTSAGTGRFDINGSNTFNEFKVDTPPHTIYFEDGKTQTVSTFVVSGIVGNIITIDSANPPIQFTLSKASGIVNCDYLDLSNSNVTGGATWYAGENSINGGNNSGWIFSLVITAEVGEFILTGIDTLITSVRNMALNVGQFILIGMNIRFFINLLTKPLKSKIRNTFPLKSKIRNTFPLKSKIRNTFPLKSKIRNTFPLKSKVKNIIFKTKLK